MGLRIIVLLNVFDPVELATAGGSAADELAEDIAEEVARYGEVERMTLFSQHKEGPIMVRTLGRRSKSCARVFAEAYLRSTTLTCCLRERRCGTSLLVRRPLR